MYKKYKHDNRAKRSDEVRFMYSLKEPRLLHWLTDEDYQEIGESIQKILRDRLQRRAARNAAEFALNCASWNWEY